LGEVNAAITSNRTTAEKAAEFWEYEDPAVLENPVNVDVPGFPGFPQVFPSVRLMGAPVVHLQPLSPPVPRLAGWRRARSALSSREYVIFVLLYTIYIARSKINL
jgi:hypothetical protein